MKPSVPEARHVVLPTGIVSTAFPRARETCRMIGIEFDPWQVGLNRCILAKGADGLYAADIIVLSIARQVGKTFDIGALVFAECIAVPGTTAVWTAHRFKVSRETFNELRALAKSPKMAPHIDYDAITTAAGNECIPFRNGSRIVFAARERGAIRGFTKVRILVLDEGQILTSSVMSDLGPTMNQAYNPLIFIMGTPPKPTDPGEVFTSLRDDALGQLAEYGHSIDGVLFVEISADEDADLEDREQWAKANPSFPGRTSERAMRRLRKLLPDDDDWRREALGIWIGYASRSAIAPAKWLRQRDAESKISDDSPVFALDVAPKMTAAALALAGYREDGAIHAEIVQREGEASLDCREGVDWVVPALVDLASRRPGLTVWIVAGSSAESLAGDLEAAGIQVERVPSSDMPAACGLIYRLVADRGVWHVGQSEADKAVEAARWQDIGDGAQRFGRRKSSGDITALYAETIAVWVLSQGLGGNVSVFRSADLDLCDECGEQPHDDPDGVHDYLCSECRTEPTEG